MEIEKKYLIKNLNLPLEGYTHKPFVQAYISTDPTIRLRREGRSYVLCIKGSGAYQREEQELKITKEQFDRLWKKIETPPVRKERYFIPLEGGLTAELDIYKDKLEGLITAEVEFESLKAMEGFKPPQWFGRDISLDNSYKNTSLALHGIPKEGSD